MFPNNDQLGSCAHKNLCYKIKDFICQCDFAISSMQKITWQNSHQKITSKDDTNCFYARRNFHASEVTISENYSLST